MIVVMEEGAPEVAIEAVISRLVAAGCDVHRSSGARRTILGVVGSVSADERAVIEEMRGVTSVVSVTPTYRLASRRFRDRPTIVEGEWGRIGGARPWVGIEPVGLPMQPAGADDRPASLPYLVASGRPFDAAVVRTAEPPDQIGALTCLTLHRRAHTKWPVLFVRRDPSWGPDEWLAAAERELERGLSHIVLLEAGSRQPGGPRTFEVTALARTAAATHLPIVADVPTIAGRASECAAIASAAIAAGASGVLLRASPVDVADGPIAPAALQWDVAADLADRLRAVGEALGR